MRSLRGALVTPQAVLDGSPVGREDHLGGAVRTGAARLHRQPYQPSGLCNLAVGIRHTSQINCGPDWGWQ